MTAPPDRTARDGTYGPFEGLRPAGHPASTRVAGMVARLRVLPVAPEVEQRDAAELPERPGW